MNGHVVDEELAEEPRGDRDDEDTRATSLGAFRLTDDGAMLMPYEKLINPDLVLIDALHWPWAKVKEQLDKLRALRPSYGGRRLYLLYNPATGRTNGTSHSFFATMCLRPANIVDRPHRHTASAIYYFFQGSGSSVVEGRRYEWRAGDLMLTAPGWANPQSFVARRRRVRADDSGQPTADRDGLAAVAEPLTALRNCSGTTGDSRRTAPL